MWVSNSEDWKFLLQLDMGYDCCERGSWLVTQVCLSPWQPVICQWILFNSEDFNGFLTAFPGVPHSSQLN